MHSQSQWEFPGAGFITTCLSSQAHTAVGESWDGCLHHEERRETSAVWGALHQLLIQTVLPVHYSEAQVEQEPFAASGNPLESRWDLRLKDEGAEEITHVKN